MGWFDRVDWHVDAAVDAGNPPENAFTHIGLYLAWAIRHDLHAPAAFDPDHIAAVKAGSMTGSDLADDIDGKLGRADFDREGAAFTEARYPDFLDAYSTEFADERDYSVVDDEAAYARIEPLLDRLYADWVAAGRPPRPPDPLSEASPEPGAGSPIDRARFVPDFRPGTARRAELDADGAPWQDGMEPDPRVPPDLDVLRRMKADLERYGPGRPGEFTPEEIEARAAAWNARQREAYPERYAHVGHVALELERLLHGPFTPDQVDSTTSTHWGSSQLRRALRALGVKPRDAIVVTAMRGSGPGTVVATIYSVAGASAEALEREFRGVIARPPGGGWEKRSIGGREAWCASGSEFTQAWWSIDGLVFHVGGADAQVAAVIAEVRDPGP